MKRALLSLFVLLCITSFSYGQYVIIKDSTNVDELILNECGDADTLTTYIRIAGGTVSGTTVLVDSLPSEFVVTGSLINPAITSFQGIGTNQAAMLLNTAVLNGNPFGIKLQYLVKVKCGSNGMIQARHKYKFSNPSLNSVVLGKDIVSAIKAPTLIIDSRGAIDQPNAVANRFYTRYWRIRNTGTNSTIKKFKFSVQYQSGLVFKALKVDGVAVTPTIIGDSVVYEINKTLRDHSRFPQDTVVVEETYQVRVCTRLDLASRIHTQWGCFTDPICKTKSKYAATQVPTSVPGMKIVLLKNNKGCYGDWDSVTVGFINVGGGVATDVLMRIDQTYPSNSRYHNGPRSRSISFIDTNSLFVKNRYMGYTKAAIDSTQMYTNLRNFWPTGFDYAAIVYLKVDSISAGDTTFVTFRTHRGEYNNTFCSYTDHALNGSVNYKNNCGNIDFRKGKTKLYWAYHRYWGKTKYDAPAYLLNGDTGTFKFTTVSSASFTHYNDSRDYFMMRTELPPGIIWDQDASGMDMVYLPNGSAQSADSIYYDKANGILEAYYLNMSTIRHRRVEPKFYLDCSVPGAGGVQSIKVQYFNVRTLSQCNMTKLPIGCLSTFSIQMYCPGPCPRGGVVATDVNFVRTNFGRPDNNNDGIPDATGSIDMSKVEWNKLAPRDTVKFTYKAKVVRGPSSPSGNFAFGYGEMKVPSFGDRLDFISANIRVIDNSSSTFTANNLGTVKSKSGNITTFAFDISGNVAGFPTGYFYDDNDSFEFTAYFVYNKDVIDNADADGDHLIQNDFYVSDVAKPSTPGDKYACFNIPGDVRIVRVFKGYNSRTARPVGCVSSPIISDYFQSIGDCCSNYAGSSHFPYEYRLFSQLDTVHVRIPAGYDVDSTQLIYSYTAGARNAKSITIYNVSPLTVDGEWHTFLLRQYYDYAGGSLVPSTTGNSWQVKNYITPSCEVPNNDRKTLYTMDRWSGEGLWTGLETRGHATPHIRGSIVNRFSANLTINNYGASIKQTNNLKVSWDVRVQNNSNTSDASNTWLGAVSRSGAITVDSVVRITKGASENMTKVNDLYHLGTLAQGGPEEVYRVYANYGGCVRDTLKISTGWNCDGYPNQLADAKGACSNDAVSAVVIPYKPLIQTDLIESPKSSVVSLCDTLTWVVSISQRQLAPAFNIELDVDIPNNGLGAKLLPASGYKYPYNVSSFTDLEPQDLGSGLFRFNLSDSITDLSNGLASVDSTPDHEIHVRVRMITDCDFQSGSSVRFYAKGQSLCGELLQPDAEFSPISIGFEPSPKLLIASSISGVIRPCNTPVKVDVSVANYELGQVLPTDSVLLILPADSRYIANSTVFTYKPLTQTEPNISIVGGRQRLIWSAYPVGILDSTVFEMKIQSDENTNCSNDFRLETISKSSYSRSCRQTTCDDEYQNSYKKANVPVFKPDLKYVAGTGSLEVVVDSTINPTSFDTLQAAGLMFNNTGNDTANLPVMTYYNDLNFNNSYDITDRLLARDTLTPVNPGNMVSYSKIFYFPNQTLTDDTVKILGTQPCNCTQLQVNPTFNFTSLPVEYLFFRASMLSQNTSIVEWTTTMEINSDRFEVYRSVGVPNNFVKVRTVVAAGNSNQLVPYAINDDVSAVPAGPIYYKLVQVDNNGSQNHSDYVTIIKTNTSQGEQVNLFPNPATKSVTLTLNNFADGNVNLDLLDVTGRVVRKISMVVREGVSSQKIDLTNMPAGVYTISGLSKAMRLVIKD